MKILLLFLLFLVSGCNTVTSLVKPSMTPEEKFANDAAKWSEKKSSLMITELGGGYPLVHNGELRIIPSTDVEVFYSKLEDERNRLKNKIEEQNSSLESLINYFEASTATYQEIEETRKWYLNKLELASSDFHNVVVSNNTSGRMISSGSGYSTSSMLAYCSSMNIKEKDCVSKPYERNGGNPIAISILDKYISDNNTGFSDYLNRLDEETLKFREIAKLAENKGRSKEEKVFIEVSSSSGCEGMKKLNFIGNMPLYASIGNPGFRVDNSYVYDIGNFKVVQSVKNGILVTSTYSGGRSNPFIYIHTSKTYPDDYVFKPKEQLVCANGTTDYLTVLGAKKRVLSFQSIETRQYYFLY
ncbi:hypothetical protein [Alcanivorax quisquiliarum]|uniref:Lipoprotein n=1 Tax=Alcanivorax quisquiliarum TaxID=2933565 RepID=A0ABT0E9G5_9GAMM|nr:hypothetical protein [Alcanivorax quisquiliarum]MCK0538478.1 hypothetical protein [Alcanivorax quisquiliarum]